MSCNQRSVVLCRGAGGGSTYCLGGRIGFVLSYTLKIEEASAFGRIMSV